MRLPDPPPAAASRLSAWQERALLALLRLYRHHLAAGLTGEALADFQAWGVSRNKLFPRTLDRTRAAVVSRALQRLEERGLLRRRNSHGRDRYNAAGPGRGPGKQRTTHLQLTPEGEALAQWLEKENANG